MNNSKPWKKYPLIASELEEVNQFVQKTIKTPHKSLQAALLQMADNGGKYLRPSLLLLAAHAVGKANKQTIKLASSIEILHMATLIHDDIIYDSDERRGNVSIQAAFGKDVAVYTGDLLFTDFFDLMLNAIDENEYLVRNAQTMRKILNGELGQMAERFNLKQTLDDYLGDIKGKTAALFRLAAGVYSLPLLLALNQPALRDKLLPLLNKKRQMTLADMQKVQSILLDSTVIDDSRKLAHQYAQKAIDNLAIFKPNPAVLLLKKLPNTLLTRSF